jgi:hypothetical protein
MGPPISVSRRQTSLFNDSPPTSRGWHPEQGLTVTTVIRRMSGGSQSRLIQCDDGKLYVLKMHPNPQGPNVLANEALGSILMHDLGFLVPRCTPVTINLKALSLFPELAMATPGGTTYPACGLHFGSEFLGGPGETLYDLLPRGYSNRIKNGTQLFPLYIFDLWANHQDDRQCVYRRDRGTGTYESFFIDNGHLFGGPAWSELDSPPRVGCSDYPQPRVIGDPRVERCLTFFKLRLPTLLHRAVALVPSEWHNGEIYTLYARLLRRLEAIRGLVDQADLTVSTALSHKVASNNLCSVGACADNQAETLHD